MRFKHISLLTAALVMLALGGCKKPEQGPGQEQGSEQVQPKPTPTPVEVEGKITITTGPLDATVASAGGTVTIAFATDNHMVAGVFDLIIAVTVVTADTIAVAVIDSEQIAVVYRKILHRMHIDIGTCADDMLIRTSRGDLLASRVDDIPCSLFAKPV